LNFRKPEPGNPETRSFYSPSSRNRPSVFNDNFFGRSKTRIPSSSEASFPRRFSQKHRFPGYFSEIPAEIPEKSIISSEYRPGDPIPIGRKKSCLFRIFRLN